MYHERPAADHLRYLGFDDGPPDGLIIVGHFHPVRVTKQFADMLGDSEPLPRAEAGWVIPRGQHRVMLIGAAASPMAGHWAHLAARAGVRQIVQFGWYGALQPGTRAGDVLVPTRAGRGDGVSRWYLEGREPADASPGLSGRLADAITGQGLRVHRGPMYTTTSLLSESREVVERWRRAGYHGVDMETAATFAVARSEGADRAAVLLRIDDLVSGEHDLFDPIDPDVLRAMNSAAQTAMEATVATLVAS
jgi:purine-nucleoside phosphorylase